jgi:chromosome segregation ATPase
VQQIKEELEKVNEDLQLAQEELISKIQENEMVNIKIFEIEKEFQEKEKNLEIKINELQKRINQLDLDIQEKENECQKLREELDMVKEQSEVLQ